MKDKERAENAMFVVSGYSMIMYCQYCMAHAEYADDGINCYSTCGASARKAGWVFHKDGFCTCKNCK